MVVLVDATDKDTWSSTSGESAVPPPLQQPPASPSSAALPPESSADEGVSTVTTVSNDGVLSSTANATQTTPESEPLAAASVNNDNEEMKNDVDAVATTDAEDDNDKEKENDKGTTMQQQQQQQQRLMDEKGPSMALSFFCVWVIPVLLLAIFCRLAVNRDIGSIDTSSSSNTPSKTRSSMSPASANTNTNMKRNIRLQLDQSYIDETEMATATLSGKKVSQQQHSGGYNRDDSYISERERQQGGGGQEQMQSKTSKKKNKRRKRRGDSRLAAEPPSTWPQSYTQLVRDISQRRPRWNNNPLHELPIMDTKKSTKTEESSSPSPSSSSGGSSSSANSLPSVSESIRRRNSNSAQDPARIRLQNKIDKLRDVYRDNPTDLFKALQFADALRLYDLKYHDGGSYEQEAIQTYHAVTELALAKREAAIAAGESTKLSQAGTTDINLEMTLEHEMKSMDALLCAIYTAHGKVYFMANMFERAVEVLSKCLSDIEPNYLDALNTRGSCHIILGNYEQGAADLMQVIQNDEYHFFSDAFTGLARILEAKEDAVENGWTTIVKLLDDLIPQFESTARLTPNTSKEFLASSLHRFHHTLFTYHDKKTKDYRTAWKHLEAANQYKMSVLPPFAAGIEAQKAYTVMQVFKQGFWPAGVGSDTVVPIFVVGFPRSGSTLLERVLDAHPAIVGTGENSVFNGRLDDIRNQIVQVSVSQNRDLLGDVTRQLAEQVVEGMRERWQVLDANTDHNKDDGDDQQERNPQRFVDKMLTNYFNVGFIHMLYPKALILHVAREPMDTLFSAYKHDFPAGTLDYTSDFESLTELYRTYRQVMEHWDQVLPGRVTHVRYVDMIHDMPGVAKAVIAATGLEWDESVLEFHKKKHAVNTLSTTQVRKGVYRDSLQSWKKYEPELQPLLKLVGNELASWEDLKTTLPGYVPPAPPSSS